MLAPKTPRSGLNIIVPILWPYINQEFLGKPTPLLLLLNSRGRHPPPVFLNMDSQVVPRAEMTNTLVHGPFPTENMLLVLRGIYSGDDYGTLRKCPEAKPGVWLHMKNKDFDLFTSELYGKKWSLKQPFTSSGMVTLEVQERLMDFLVKCCHLILHEIEPDNLFSDMYPAYPEPELPFNAQGQGLQTFLLEITFEAPYRVSTRFNFANLEKLFAAKAAAAEDHVWAMREDPNYLGEQISDVHDLVELIGDRKGHRSKGGAAIGEVLTNAYTMVEIFTEAHQITKRLRNLQEKYASVVSPTEPLPVEYNDQIAIFFLSSLLVEPERPMTNNEYFLLEWLLGSLCHKRGNSGRGNVVPDIYIMNLAINDLELQTERDKTIRDLLSTPAHAMLGDTAIVIQALHALERFEPWNIGFGIAPDDESMEWSHDYIQARIDVWSEIKQAFQIEPTPNLVPFFKPDLRKFTCPAHRRRNKENIEMMRRAESNLDAFWARADEYLYERTEDMDDSILMGLLKRPRALQRTPEWVEPAKGKKQTRGTLIKLTETEEEGEVNARPEDPKPIFKVERRALKTFRTLFYDPDVTSTPGEVPWNDLLHALTSVGLTAEKLYGSVWQFSLCTLDASASIHFHEPHPHNKVPFVIARRHGRRLHRTYGWTGEQFVLDK
ncbi:hypothetical protein FBEOM_4751 [Fusarium beomiforme]|uniref:Uncharacterized protein n=1 Tax=Fusarium beomiforme TaxID=44412 RepID=A0A9P5E0L8_9HYPO|nr:hypothetical protein FBEOM_4751 [Fusarium beomiforme]